MAKPLTQKEQRQKIIDDRAKRLARDAAKQGITPEQLLKKKRDTYMNVVGGAASLAIPFGALAGTAAKIYKGIMAGKKAVPAAKTVAQAATKPTTSTVSKGAKRLSKADKAAQIAKGKPSAVKNVSPTKLAQMTPQQRKAVQNLQKVNAKPATRNQAGKATAQARVAARSKMTPQQRKATQNLGNINAARTARKPSSSAATPKRSKITITPPVRKPMTNLQKAGIGIGTLGALGGATYLGTRGQKKSQAAIPTPKSRPKTKTPMNEGNTVAGMKGKKTEGKDPRGNQIKPTPGKIVMPKKFKGSYNKNTHKLSNITIDGKKSTYVLPKNMTSSKAKSLLMGTAKKKAGGTPGKYKGFSKLPEAVQKKMSPRLAAKYEAGGYLDRMEKRLSMMESASREKKEKDKYKPTKRKIIKTKKMKKGGSVNSSKVARQVKGFGAARKPKK